MADRKVAPRLGPQGVPWLLLMFSLPVKRASERVDVWRKLKRYGALALPTSGYLLPNTAANLEHFHWLAASVRKHDGDASVAQVQSLDNHSHEDLQRLFMEARSRDYEALGKRLRKALTQKRRAPSELMRFRRHLQEIVAVDFFNSPLRSRIESLLAAANSAHATPLKQPNRFKKDYQNRIWVTRPRPGIDRVSSAWLICHFIDAKPRFEFAPDSRQLPDAIAFDMFQQGGFGHVGDDCTFETLCKQFRISDSKVLTIGEMIHDADLGDEKFGRVEAVGMDRVLIGWAEQGMADEELLRRGMELIEGLYQSIA